MESHERRMGSRWPWLCLERGSGGCEFCSCHLPKRAVELLQGGAIPCGLANFTLMDPLTALKVLREISLVSLLSGGFTKPFCFRGHAEKLHGR